MKNYNIIIFEILKIWIINLYKTNHLLIIREKIFKVNSCWLSKVSRNKAVPPRLILHFYIKNKFLFFLLNYILHLYTLYLYIYIYKIYIYILYYDEIYKDNFIICLHYKFSILIQFSSLIKRNKLIYYRNKFIWLSFIMQTQENHWKIFEILISSPTFFSFFFIFSSMLTQLSAFINFSGK